MARLSDRQFQRIASAVAEPRRYRILAELAARGDAMACGDIVAKHRVSAATISHHLKELETAGLITIVRTGKFADITFQRAVWNAYLARIGEL
jgi:ArsR family transcriptional regulator, arsenate/arsenite/antimonite-responsive transcriptional repressor